MGGPGIVTGRRDEEERPFALVLALLALAALALLATLVVRLLG